MKLEPGALLGNGKYQLIQHLGEGSQADVWSARQLGLAGFSKDVVLKCMDVGAVGPAHQQLMLREARLAAGLRHPNIIEIYDVGEDDDLLYIAMEHIQGTDLDVILQRSMAQHQRPIPWALATAMGIEVCKGLYYAHAQVKQQDDNPLLLVHRDLKPSNILLSQQGFVKVIDFGIAKAMHPKQRKDATHAGKIKGTPAYMSPEQIMEKPIDARSDLYSLGVILFELYTGRRPFQSEELFTMLIQVVQEDPPTPRSLRPDLPPEIDDIVNKLLTKKPENRFQNARAVRRALESILRSKQLFIEPEDLSAFYQSFALDDSIPSTPRQKQQQAMLESPPPPDDALASQSGMSFQVVELGNQQQTDTNLPPHRPSVDASPSFDQLIASEDASFERVDITFEPQAGDAGKPAPAHPEASPNATPQPDNRQQAPKAADPAAPDPAAPAQQATPLGLQTPTPAAAAQTTTPANPITKTEESPTSSLKGLDPASLLSGANDLLPLDDLDSIFAALEMPSTKDTSSNAASMLSSLTAPPTEPHAATTKAPDINATHNPDPTTPTYSPPSLFEALQEEATVDHVINTNEAPTSAAEAAAVEAAAVEAAAVPTAIETPASPDTQEFDPTQTPTATSTPFSPLAPDKTGAMDASPATLPTEEIGLATSATMAAPGMSAPGMGAASQAGVLSSGASIDAEQEEESTRATPQEADTTSAPTSQNVRYQAETKESPSQATDQKAATTQEAPSLAKERPGPSPTDTPEPLIATMGFTMQMGSFSSQQAATLPSTPAVSSDVPRAATAAYPAFPGPTTSSSKEAGHFIDVLAPPNDIESSSDTSLDASPFANVDPNHPPPMPKADPPGALADYDLAALDDLLGYDEGDRTMASPSPLLEPNKPEAKPLTKAPAKISLGININEDAMGATIQDGISVGQVLEASTKLTLDEPLSVDQILDEHQKQGVPVIRANQIPARPPPTPAQAPTEAEPQDDELFFLEEGEKTALNIDLIVDERTTSQTPAAMLKQTKNTSIWLWGFLLAGIVALGAGGYFLFFR